MATALERAQKELERIKRNIEISYGFNKENVKRYHEFRKYVYKTSVNEAQKTALATMKRPLVEFNILPAYLNRLIGEFAKHEPSIEVCPAEGVPVNHEVIEIVEGHLRHIIYEANKNSFSEKIYRDELSGGFSTFRVCTEYASPMSFKQIIKWERCFDPTMCGFDPMARHSHKGDGQYCFEIYPLTEEDFKRQFPDADGSQFKYSRKFDKNGDLGGFNWTYKDSQTQKIIICGDYYEKKKKKVRIVQLSNGMVVPIKKYEEEKAKWRGIEQFPIVVGGSRVTELEIICRYRLTESEILEYEETDYTYLPLIFVEGQAIELTEGQGNCVYNMTIPYVYHAKGAQDLKNFSGQTLANYLENQIQHKFIIKKEALPQEQDFIEAINNIQMASTVVVNAFNENNPDQPIPEPIREVVNVAAPPEIMNSFQAADITTQTILGSFASNLAKNDNNLSGRAVIETASQDNAAAMPYIMGYLAAIKQASLITVDLMPKYILGKREIPVVDKKGKRNYATVNADNYPQLDYEQNALQVEIEPGISFQVQKTQAMQQIIGLMQASQQFAEFMNSDEGLPILLKNLTMYGSDEIQEVVPKWQQKRAEQQQQMQQMQMQMMQNNPQMISAQATQVRAQAEIAKVQMQKEQQQFENQIEVAKLGIEKERVDNEAVIAQVQATQEDTRLALERTREETSLTNHALDAAAKIADIEHKQTMDHHESHRKNIKLHHDITKGAKENEEIPTE